jgi:glycosyltransferase involved in cell wall biosynthesis
MLNYLSFVLAGLAFAPWMLRKKKYDCVMVYAPSPILQAIPAVFVSFLKRCSLVIWVQDLWPDSLAATGYVNNPLILRAVRSVVSWIYSRADLLLVQSRAFQVPVASMAPGKSVVFYPNSVDGVFSVAPSSEVMLPDVPALDEGFAVVFAGNVGSAQAVEVIVDAAAMLKDVPQIRFVVFGQGSRWSWMQEQVQLRKLGNLYLPGQFPVETMPGLMQKAGALLVTLADEPAFALTVPNKVQAYMATGRPILACLNGEGARLVMEADAGISIPAQDAKGLAAAVMKMYRLSDKEQARMGANGRRYYEAHFDHDKLAEELVAHLRAMSGTNRSVA